MTWHRWRPLQLSVAASSFISTAAAQEDIFDGSTSQVYFLHVIFGDRTDFLEESSSGLSFLFDSRSVKTLSMHRTH